MMRPTDRGMDRIDDALAEASPDAERVRQEQVSVEPGPARIDAPAAIGRNRALPGAEPLGARQVAVGKAASLLLK